MKKVGFQSIHLKFVLIYMLLILIAMQVIGVYFVRELEKSLVQGFRDSLTQQTNLLSYNLKQEFKKLYKKQKQSQQMKRLKLQFENLPLIRRKLYKR